VAEGRTVLPADTNRRYDTIVPMAGAISSLISAFDVHSLPPDDRLRSDSMAGNRNEH
jgi:hypothetical protein